MKNIDINEAISLVFNKLSKLSTEDFKKELEKHTNGDVAEIILETNALGVGELEAESYNSDYYSVAFKPVRIDSSFIDATAQLSTLVNSSFYDLAIQIPILIGSSFIDTTAQLSALVSSSFYDLAIQIPTSISSSFIDTAVESSENEKLLKQNEDHTSYFYKEKKQNISDGLALAA